ncbi:MAG TPA: hypothetical protein PKH32_09965, partial [Verrucomicrobiota bacterium]|nr:hypothetical protein [Verrucomicrobiota bacterium]
SNIGMFGSLNGVPTDLFQGATFVEPISGKTFRISYRAEGATFDAGGNDIMLEVVAPVGGDELTWRGSAANNDWDLSTPNWWNGSSLVAFANSDFVMFDDSGSNHVPVNLVGDLTPATVLFNATKPYVFAGSGKLTGTVVITKTNTGTVTFLTDNDPVGSTTIHEGTIQLGDNGTSGSLTGVITVNPNGVLAYNRSDDVVLSTAAFSGTGGFVHQGSGQLIITGEIPFSGKTTNLGGLLQFGDGTTLGGSIGGEVHVPAGKTVRYFYSNGTKEVPNSLSGSGSVEYDSSLGGTIRIQGTAVSSNFTGTATLITGTRLQAADGNGGDALGNGSTVNVPEFSQVWLDRSATPYNQIFNIAGTGYVGDFPELGALRLFGAVLNGEINLLDNSRVGGTISSATIYAPIKGPFQLEVLGNADYQLHMGPTNGLHTYASTLITRGWINALNSNAISTGPLMIDVAGGLLLNGNNLTVASLSDAFSGLVTGDGARVHNNHGSLPATLTVGTDNSSTLFGGSFADGNNAPLGLTKVGSGTLTLTAVSSNTGSVTVNGGTIALIEPASFPNASLIAVGAGATFDVLGRSDQSLVLHAGQRLQGNGTVAGNVNALAGSTINPGDSVGTLNISGNLTVSGQLLMELNRTNTPANSDRINVGGTFSSATGTLVVSNVGPALEAGDSFQLFPSGRAFAAVILPTNDPVNRMQYTWTDTVAVDGRITVLTATPALDTTPTNVTATVSGGSVTLSWPSSHIGWSLQVQTNALSTGLSNNWTTLGFENTNSVELPIDPANPAVFFRLALPE